MAIAAPPILRTISDEDINNTKVPTIDFSVFSCHTQSVERCVELVTKASNSVVGEEARNGFIGALMDSRKVLPNYETKA